MRGPVQLPRETRRLQSRRRLFENLDAVESCGTWGDWTLVDEDVFGNNAVRSGVDFVLHCLGDLLPWTADIGCRRYSVARAADTQPRDGDEAVRGGLNASDAQ
jgi:hypothetical protein